MSAKGLKAIVRTMRDNKRERMPGLLSQAMAEGLPPEGDDARDAGEALAGCALAGAVVSTDRQRGLRPRARGDGRGGAPEVRVLGTEGAARPRECDPLDT